MRGLGCVASIVGGVAWALVPYLSGDNADYADYAGIGLLSLSWLILGYGVLFATGGGMAYVVVQQCVNAAPLARPGLVNGYLVHQAPGAHYIVETGPFGH